MATLRTFTAGISGIDLNQRHARKDGLVFEELPQLRECPRVQNRALSFPSPDSRPDTSQFFYGNPAHCAFGFLNDLFRNGMVDGLGKASFLARQLFEVAFGGRRASGLKFFPEFAMAEAHIVQVGAAEGFAIGICGNDHDAHIDAKKFIHVLRFRIIDIASRSQKELAAMVDQIGLALLREKLLFLALPGRIRHRLASIHCPDAHALFADAEDAGIVADGPMLGKTPLDFLVQLVGIGDLAEDMHGHLGAEREPLAGRVVQQFMQIELAKGLPFPRFIAQPVRALVGSLQRAQQQLVLFGIRIQTDFRCNLQQLNYTPERKLKANRLKTVVSDRLHK